MPVALPGAAGGGISRSTQGRSGGSRGRRAALRRAHAEHTTGPPLGPLNLIYTPAAMVLAQFAVAAPLAAGLTRSALGLLDADLVGALRVDGATERRMAWEMVRAAPAQVLVALAAAFGRAISEVGASLMVGGNILNQTRVLTTAITLETSRGEFARALALGLLLLALAFLVNATLLRGARGMAGAGLS